MCDIKEPESFENQRKILEQLSVLQQNVEYNRKLLEAIVEHLPAQAANKDIKKMLETQMGTVRSLFEQSNFQGKDEIIKMFDSLIGSKL